MNTRFFFALLVIAVIVSACAPAMTDNSAPVAAVPAANSKTLSLIPKTGGSKEVTTVRSESQSQAPRLYSGEVFLSDNGAPDAKLNTNVQSACMLVDNQPERHGGCSE